MPLARKLPDVQWIELANVLPEDDGSPTPAYRTADECDADYDTADRSPSSPERKAVADDIAKMATGGARLLLSDVEEAPLEGRFLGPAWD